MGIIGGALCLSGMVLIVLSFIPLIRDIKNKEKRASKTSLKLAGPGLIALILGIIIIPADRETQQAEEAETVTAAAEEEKTEDISKDSEQVADEAEPLRNEVNIDKEVQFTDHSVTFKEAIFYEEDGNYFVDLDLEWDNQSFGEKTTFFRANMMDVLQEGQSLDEINNAWQDKSSDVFFPNAGGTWFVELTYQLESYDGVEVKLIPMNEIDDTESIMININ
ncbi:hypothetical protein ACTHP3_05285 [Shouchella rhizosphaerae]|uniref:hypothetical protein n=1 Tax=Shouchella rhizosphaerae TaxID=866786 RepID=UPI003F805638